MSNETGGHWYRADGEPCHTLPTGPKAKNPTRPVNIRDAKQLGLIPSVTTILGVMSKPQLDGWKQKQITQAAWNARGLWEDGDTYEAYHERITTAAFRQVQDAADAGTLIHYGAELALQNMEYAEDAPVYLPQLDKTFPLKTFIKPIEEFVKKNEIETTSHELRLVNLQEGYAGTTDVSFRSKKGFGILDFKSKKTKPGYRCEPFDGQAMQVAAYHVAHYHSVPAKETHTVGCNLFVSTTEPGRVEACWYDGDRLSREWEAFKNCCGLWRHIKGYDPRKNAHVNV